MLRNSSKDRAKGKALEMRGKVKEAAGKATKNRDLQDEGTVDKAAGKVQNKLGQVKRVFERD